MRRTFLCFVALSLLALSSVARADLLDDAAALQRQWESEIIAVYAGDASTESWQQTLQVTRAFLPHLRAPAAQQLWQADLPKAPPAPLVRGDATQNNIPTLWAAIFTEDKFQRPLWKPKGTCFAARKASQGHV